MTYLEIDEALVSITRQLCAACKERLDAIPRENASERKAVQLEYGMYTFCGNAGLLFNTGWERTKVLHVRQTLWNNELHKFPHIQTRYQTLDGDDKLCSRRSARRALSAPIVARRTDSRTGSGKNGK